MDLYIIRNVDFQNRDERGRLIQLVHDGFKQVNVLESNKGSVRGAHYHKRSVEAFFIVSGSVNVVFTEREQKEEAHFQEGDFFEIHPYVMHYMEFPEDCLMVQMYSTPVVQSDGEKDIYSV